MINITFKYDQDNLYKGFTSEGHAGFAKFGKDIVCSSVSALIVTFVNSVEELTNAKIKVIEKSGYVDAVIEEEKDYSNPEVQLLFKALVVGLKGIEESYSKYVKLTNRR